jgi:glutaredoxin-related protein
MQKSHQANAPKTAVTMERNTTTERTPACNSGFAKKRVQWLIEHSTSYQHLWYIDILVLRNPLLRKAAKRYSQW